MAPLTNVLSVATLAGLTGLAAAAPHIGPQIGANAVNNVGTEGRTSLVQARNPNYRFNGAVSVYKTYLKFGVPIPDALQAAVDRTGMVTKRSEGSSVATPIDNFDNAYTIPVSIGTPPQVVHLDLDTGSSDLWVYSSETNSSEVNGQNMYSPNKSSTSAIKPGYTWTVEYGDFSTSSGNIFTDNITIGGITVASQAIEVAEEVSASFTANTQIDGLIGMGFARLNKAKPKAVATFFTNVESSLDEPLFTADLKHEAPGKYDFGFIDSSLYTGPITYVPVDPYPGYWTWNSSGYAVGTDTFNSTSIEGIADTGTTLLYLPFPIIDEYYAKVAGSYNNATIGGYVFSCSATLPSFTFGVGSSRITIPPEYLNYGPMEINSTTCFGGLQDSTNIGFNIFGDVALKSALVVFNGGTPPTIGWAAKTLN